MSVTPCLRRNDADVSMEVSSPALLVTPPLAPAIPAFMMMKNSPNRDALDLTADGGGLASAEVRLAEYLSPVRPTRATAAARTTPARASPMKQDEEWRDDALLFSPNRVYGAKHPLPLLPRSSEHERVSPETVHNLLTGKYESKVQNFMLLDNRYCYEHEGGTIRGARSITSPKQIVALFDELSATDSTVVICFCEFSQKRGPRAYSFIRDFDRYHNEHRYPYLNYPFLYLLEGGYREYYSQYPEDCKGGYRLMTDKLYMEELRLAKQQEKLVWDSKDMQRRRQKVHPKSPKSTNSTLSGRPPLRPLWNQITTPTRRLAAVIAPQQKPEKSPSSNMPVASLNFGSPRQAPAVDPFCAEPLLFSPPPRALASSAASPRADTAASISNCTETMAFRRLLLSPGVAGAAMAVNLPTSSRNSASSSFSSSSSVAATAVAASRRAPLPRSRTLFGGGNADPLAQSVTSTTSSSGSSWISPSSRSPASSSGSVLSWSLAGLPMLGPAQPSLTSFSADGSPNSAGSNSILPCRLFGQSCASPSTATTIATTTTTEGSESPPNASVSLASTVLCPMKRKPLSPTSLQPLAAAFDEVASSPKFSHPEDGPQPQEEEEADQEQTELNDMEMDQQMPSSFKMLSSNRLSFGISDTFSHSASCHSVPEFEDIETEGRKRNPRRSRGPGYALLASLPQPYQPLSNSVVPSALHFVGGDEDMGSPTHPIF